MDKFGKTWFSLAVFLAGGHDVCSDSEDVVGHVSLLQTKAELLNSQVPGDVVSRIADQDLFGKREVVHPHRVQLRLRRAMRKARSSKYSSINDQHLLNVIMNDVEGDTKQGRARHTLTGRRQDSTGGKGADQTDWSDDLAFRMFEGAQRKQDREGVRNESHMRADNQVVPRATGKPAFQSYRCDTASTCGDCGSANDLNVGLDGARFDKASRSSAADVCGPVCDSHAECAGFNFVESRGRCYYRRSTACQKSSDADRDCYTKASSASAEDELLAAAGSDIIEAPQDKVQDEISQCRPYMESTGCGWTNEWSCPDQRSGSLGEAGINGGQDTLGFRCCCTHGLWAVDTTVSNNDGMKTAAKHHVENNPLKTRHTKGLQEIKHVDKGIDAADGKFVATLLRGEKASNSKRREDVKHAGKEKRTSKVGRREGLKSADKEVKAFRADSREEGKHVSKGEKDSKVEGREEIKHASKDKKAHTVDKRKDAGRAKVGKKASKVEMRDGVKHTGKEEKASKDEMRERVKQSDNDVEALESEKRADGKHADKDSSRTKDQRREKVKRGDNKKMAIVVEP